LVANLNPGDYRQVIRPLRNASLLRGSRAWDKRGNVEKKFLELGVGGRQSPNATLLTMTAIGTSQLKDSPVRKRERADATCSGKVFHHGVDLSHT
jgi:hypothetical protein